MDGKGDFIGFKVSLVFGFILNFFKVRGINELLNIFIEGILCIGVVGIFKRVRKMVRRLLIIFNVELK